ncbi:MAG: hypothetical protein OEX07_10105, partial [Gammaproteobacteria bacterium]|nr:hypothetical protein [Gammaproteobacteria bacterium]
GNGGMAASIKLTTVGALENTAAIDASGGDTVDPAADGGVAAQISLKTELGHLYNDGVLSAVGGDGKVNGANANSIFLTVTSDWLGSVKNSGAINTSGGMGETGNGGHAGSITLRSIGDDLINSGSLTANGGDAADGFNGGNAGNISFSSQWGKFETPPGNIIVSGNLAAKGGDASGALGGVGGDGGIIGFAGNDAYEYQHKQLLGLWGYTDISAKGGTGESPGAGANVTLLIDNPGNVYPNNWEWSSLGSIINEADINTSGASSSAADLAGAFRGGAGGDVSMRIDSNVLGDTSTLMNSGSIVTASGNNQNSNATANSGDVELIGPAITNTASIDTSAGDDTSVANAALASEPTPVAALGNARGNHAGSIQMLAEGGALLNSGALLSSGGNAEEIGGNAGPISLLAETLNNTGDLTANGGNSTVLTLTTSKGGNAQFISLKSKVSGQMANSSTLSNQAGAGATAGTSASQFMIDGY